MLFSIRAAIAPAVPSPRMAILMVPITFLKVSDVPWGFQ
ncbi:hypothetical protein EV13_0380 [Prochlorococcus sp. MIT 0702]|nr:hypothetical protein EV13_0380 [Prochlorococcus sp. MIT 0702]